MASSRKRSALSPLEDNNVPRTLPRTVPAAQGAGTVLYKVLWQGFPPEVATWEEEDDIPCGEVDYVGDYEAALVAEDAEDEDQQQSSA